MKIHFPNYKYSLINLAGSIMKEFGLESLYPSSRTLDKILKYGYSNVIVIVYDELSVLEVDRKVPTNTFLAKHRLKNMSGVFPNTKECSLRVLETGGIFSTDYDDTIITRINENRLGQAYGIFPTGLGAYQSRDEMYKRIINLCDGNSKKYIYAYCDQYDINTLNDEIEHLSDDIVDSIIFIVSNRGKILDEMEEIDLTFYTDLLDTIDKFELIEGRLLLVSVSDEKQFLDKYYQYLSRDFRLLTKEDALKKLILGNNEICNFSYNYLIVGRENKYFKNTNSLSSGGASEEEMLVPLFNICRKKKDDQVVIRRVKFEDYEDFSRLANQLHGNRVACRGDIFQKTSFSLSRTDFYNLCNSFEGKLIYVYVLSEKIIGYIKFDIDDHLGSRIYSDKCALKIYELYVLEEYRKQGVATALYEEVYRYAKHIHAERIEFLVWDFDENTKQFVSSLQMKVQNSCYEIRM